MLTSCSDDSSKDPSSILPKKIVYTEGDYSNTTSFIYDGNKIVQYTNDDGEMTVYTYTGNLITKEQSYATGKNINQTLEYTYENDKLKSYVSTEYDGTQIYKSKKVYTHNTDGTVNYKGYNINATTGVETFSYTGKLTFINGNLVKEENGNNVNTKEYDTKNNPTKNILGFDKLLSSDFSANNCTKETYTYPSDTSVHTNEYDYNADGFPTVQRSFHEGSATGTTKYTY